MPSRPIWCARTPQEEKLLKLLFGEGVEPEDLAHHYMMVNRLATQHDEMGGVSPLFWHLQRKQDPGSTPPATACPPMIPTLRKP